MLRKRYEKVHACKTDIYILSISLTNLSIGESVGTPPPVPCSFCRILLPGSCPDDPETLRILETTIGVVYGNDQVKSHIGNVRGFVMLMFSVCTSQYENLYRNGCKNVYDKTKFLL